MTEKGFKTFIVILIAIASVLIIFIVGFLIIGLSYGDGISKASTDFYGDVMQRSNISNDTKIVDIAMLGAHDAFSDKIVSSSATDPGDTDGLASNDFVNTFAKGMAVRYSKAQRDGALTLLNAGVRYFDVRVSFYEGFWYTRHGYISEFLGSYLNEIIQFLLDNPKEFIIFDIQDAYVGNSSYKALFDYIGSIKYALQSGFGKSLLSFVNYDPANTPLSELTYGQVTNNGESAGVVILCKTSVTETNKYHYNRENAIRSVWHNSISNEDMLSGITNEFELLSADPTLDRGKIRVNQAQKTFSSNIFASIGGWSLLKLAEDFNAILIENESFKAWLSVMPVFMVDYSNSAKGNFNDRVNEIIIEFNNNLQ